MPDQRTGRQHPQGRLRQFLVAERRPRRQLVLAGAARSASRTPESSPAATRESRPAAWPSRPARTRATRARLDAGVSNARGRMPSHDGHPRTPVAGDMSTVGLAKELTGPSAGAVVGTRPACFMGKVPVWSDGSATLSNMCSGAGSGADGGAGGGGSAGGGGAVDAGCLDPMLDRLLAVEVAGLPDEALAADLVGLRVAVSRLESEFARRLVVFDRRGAAGVTGAVSTATWLRGACRLSAGEAGERVRTARVLADDLPVTADALAAGTSPTPVSYTHLRAHETRHDLVCRLLLEKKKKK